MRAWYSEDAGAPIALAAGMSGPQTTNTSAGTTSQTVSYAGSGLVFVNTYTANVTTAYQAVILASENYLQSQITNTCTVDWTPRFTGVGCLSGP